MILAAVAANWFFYEHALEARIAVSIAFGMVAALACDYFGLN